MRAALWPEADADELLQELDAMYADPDGPSFVAVRLDGSLCGFAEVSVRRYANGVDESPCAFLEGWWVDEDLRRTGVGRALVAAVEAWARGRRFTELGSDAEQHNTVSHRAHQALGFEERARVIYYRKRL